jgi:hypothetical protein
MFGVCMCLLNVCAVLCVGRDLATSWSLVQGVLSIVNRTGNWKEGRAHKGCRVIEKEEEQEQEQEQEKEWKMSENFLWLITRY